MPTTDTTTASQLPAPDPAWEDAKRRLWAMTTDQRIHAMRAGELSLRLCLHWASRRPHEVPLFNGEWEFIAAATPDVADRAHQAQRARVVESLLRRPDSPEPARLSGRS